MNYPLLSTYSVNLYPAVIYTAWLRAVGVSAILPQKSYDFRLTAFLTSKQ